MSGKKQQRWYLGGMGACLAVCFTHPLDTIKVHLQTQQGKDPIHRVLVNTLKTNGLMGIYSGLSASVLRQATYTSVRFGAYEVARARLTPSDGSPLPFTTKVALAAMGGAIGILAGNPADVVNVRMQNDMRLPVAQRVGYRHVFHGLATIVRVEGVLALYRGLQANIPRSILINIGQVACYDQAKQGVLSTGILKEGVALHFLSSFIAGTMATTLTQPVDVMKTRLMQGTQFNSIAEVFMATAKEGPLAFYKGFVPAWIRLSPQTILTWIFLERLRLIFPPK